MKDNTYLRLIKYPGAKNVLTPDIKNVFERSGMKLFVDVFGGSGTVSLNIGAHRIIYNEIDPDLSNLFRHVQEHPERMAQMLRKLISEGEFPPLEKIKGNEKDSNTIERAFNTLIRFTTSFGGMGDTYNTREKSSMGYAKKTLEQFSSINRVVKGWKIENLDFREIFKKYDSNSTFFYLDPPYSDRKWYNYNFIREDYVDLRDLMFNSTGKYLMNVNREDEFIAEIFGEPQFTKEYENKNQDVSIGYMPPRVKSFYTNLRNLKLKNED